MNNAQQLFFLSLSMRHRKTPFQQNVCLSLQRILQHYYSKWYLRSRAQRKINMGRSCRDHPLWWRPHDRNSQYNVTSQLEVVELSSHCRSLCPPSPFGHKLRQMDIYCFHYICCTCLFRYPVTWIIFEILNIWESVLHIACSYLYTKWRWWNIIQLDDFGF